ncbi:pseudouridine-5'-phosphate glycosidase [Curvivirga sp.]|uniref:pseudouridine-5'-phosphate glycosidase n=1 Tax=Curvivirga sp. TaxID=2856848 RepID=UPI003B5C7096
MNEFLEISAEVKSALDAGKAVVALESTIITHGLPWPQNKEIALDLETAIREEGAVPATIGIIEGKMIVGLSETQVTDMAQMKDVVKASRRDLATVCALKQNGSTTVAATMIIAAMAGIRLFATGGIGGVHRGAESDFDISADLTEFAKTPICVVCAGAKSILDLPKTLEFLETQGVPLVGFNTKDFPAFHSRESGLTLDASVANADEAAAMLKARDHLALGGGEVIANPIPEADAIAKDVVDQWVSKALAMAAEQGVTGKAVTPFLLAQLADISDGESIKANLALILNNARVASRIAIAYSKG